MNKPLAKNNAQAMQALFNPRVVAVLGVSEDITKHNRVAFDNARRFGFAGKVYPIHRTLKEIDGVLCYPTMADLPERPDLVFCAIPADATLSALPEAAAAGAKVMIIGSAGYAESGPEGQARQAELDRIVATSGIRIVGPNCNGIYNNTLGLSLGFNTAHRRLIAKGDIAILSHSGALFDVMHTKLAELEVGLSFFISAGNEADFDILDYLEHAVDDPATKVVAMLVDALSDGARFRALAARARANGKQIVALKIGLTEIGAQAATAHSSRLASGAAGYAALFEAAGVPVVQSLEGMLTAAAMLSRFGRHAGGLAAFTTSGAGASLLADLALKVGVPLAEYRPETLEQIQKYLRFSHMNNPTDFGIFGGMPRAPDVPMIFATDPGVGMVMQQMQTFRPWQAGPIVAALTKARETSGKPMIALAPGALSDEQKASMQGAGIAVFRDTFATLQGVSAVLSPQRAEPVLPAVAAPAGMDALLEKTGPLSEPESLALLGRFGIPVVPTRLALSLDETVAAAREVGFPVVLKGVVPGMAHKSDAGMVKVGLRDADAVAAAWRAMGGPASAAIQPMIRGEVEAIAGLTWSEDVGAMLLVGLGGIYAEALKDVTMVSVPCGRDLLVEKLSQGALGRVLTSPRWKMPGALDALVDVLLKLQDFAVWAGDRIEAVDVNPLIVGEQGVMAVDALVVPRAPN